MGSKSKISFEHREIRMIAREGRNIECIRLATQSLIAWQFAMQYTCHRRVTMLLHKMNMQTLLNFSR